MKKRFAASAMILAMSAATVLSPLTAFAEAEEQELNIAIFQGGYGDAYWNQMVELFEESHEGVKVNMTISPTIGDIIRPQIVAGNAPDFICLNDGGEDGVILSLIKDHALLNLDDVFDGENYAGTGTLRDDITDGILSSTKCAPYGDDEIYLAPFNSGPQGLIYNKTFFDENNLEVPKTWDEFKTVVQKLKDAGIGTYILFQETYHKQSYLKLHPAGPKHDYDYHTEAMDRAMDGGIDDVGLGVLFGLEMYKYEFAGLLMHAEHLEAVWGVGPHTISVPRICPADDIDPASFENAVPDDLFLKIVALIRMAVPYTGMIMSTREGQRIRTEALKLGISQISGGSRTSVGGYALRSVQEMEEKTEQFETNDRRSLDEIVRWLLENHYLPSFCTACYRAGRTGDRFMEWAKDGSIATYCQANAIMTMKEYMCDYASKETREAGERVIANELPKIPHEKIRIASEKRLIRIADGERDFRF